MSEERRPDRGRGAKGSGGADPTDRPEAASRVGEVLDKVIRKLGLEKELAGQVALAEWDAVVGDRIAGVTRARDVSRGTLFVEVRSSPWLSELNLMRHDLIRRLNARLPGARIERIVFLLAERSDEETAG